MSVDRSWGWRSCRGTWRGMGEERGGRRWRGGIELWRGPGSVRMWRMSLRTLRYWRRIRWTSRPSPYSTPEDTSPVKIEAAIDLSTHAPGVRSSNGADPFPTNPAPALGPSVRIHRSEWFIRRALRNSPLPTRPIPRESTPIGSMLELKSQPRSVPPQYTLGPDNRGYTILQDLGWSGGGLGRPAMAAADVDRVFECRTTRRRYLGAGAELDTNGHPVIDLTDDPTTPMTLMIPTANPRTVGRLALTDPVESNLSPRPSS